MMDTPSSFQMVDTPLVETFYPFFFFAYVEFMSIRGSVVLKEDSEDEEIHFDVFAYYP